jgi:hypothetical protein
MSICQPRAALQKIAPTFLQRRDDMHTIRKAKTLKLVGSLLAIANLVFVQAIGSASAGEKNRSAAAAAAAAAAGAANGRKLKQDNRIDERLDAPTQVQPPRNPNTRAIIAGVNRDLQRQAIEKHQGELLTLQRKMKDEGDSIELSESEREPLVHRKAMVVSLAIEEINKSNLPNYEKRDRMLELVDADLLNSEHREVYSDDPDLRQIIDTALKDWKRENKGEPIGERGGQLKLEFFAFLEAAREDFEVSRVSRD